MCPVSPSGDRATTAQRRNLERTNEVAKEREILLHKLGEDENKIDALKKRADMLALFKDMITPQQEAAGGQ